VAMRRIARKLTPGKTMTHKKTSINRRWREVR